MCGYTLLFYSVTPFELLEPLLNFYYYSRSCSEYEIGYVIIVFESNVLIIVMIALSSLFRLVSS